MRINRYFLLYIKMFNLICKMFNLKWKTCSMFSISFQSFERCRKNRRWNMVKGDICRYIVHPCIHPYGLNEKVALFGFWMRPIYFLEKLSAPKIQPDRIIQFLTLTKTLVSVVFIWELFEVAHGARPITILYSSDSPWIK